MKRFLTFAATLLALSAPALAEQTSVENQCGAGGIGKGCNVAATVDLARAVDIPVIASGGVANIGEIHVLALHNRDGVEGVITGRALYDGRLDLAAALSVAAAA